MITGLFKEQGAAAWKRNPKGDPKGNGKETSNDRQLGFVLNGPRKDNVREEMRAASDTM